MVIVESKIVNFESKMIIFGLKITDFEIKMVDFEWKWSISNKQVDLNICLSATLLFENIRIPDFEIWIRANRGKGDGRLRGWRRSGITVLKYISTRIRVFSFGRRLFYYRYNKNKTFFCFNSSGY